MYTVYMGAWTDTAIYPPVCGEYASYMDSSAIFGGHFAYSGSTILYIHTLPAFAVLPCAFELHVAVDAGS